MRRHHTPACIPIPQRRALALAAALVAALTPACELEGDPQHPIGAPPTCHRVSDAPITGELAQDLIGAWLSEDATATLTFSADGRWRERDPQRHTTLASGTFSAHADLLTMRAGDAVRRERVEVLPDRLIVWISDASRDHLTYWRARCIASPSPGATP